MHHCRKKPENREFPKTEVLVTVNGLGLDQELGSDLLQILGPICFWLVGAHGWLDDVSVAWFGQVLSYLSLLLHCSKNGL